MKKNDGLKSFLTGVFSALTIGALTALTEGSNLSTTSIGRPYANESYVAVGTKTITDYQITQERMELLLPALQFLKLPVLHSVQKYIKLMTMDLLVLALVRRYQL